MAPVLFLIHMHAAIEVINAQADYRKFQYKTWKDHLFAGRPLRTRNDVELFDVSSSLFADDGAFLFESREEM